MLCRNIGIIDKGQNYRKYDMKALLNKLNVELSRTRFRAEGHKTAGHRVGNDAHD